MIKFGPAGLGPSESAEDVLEQYHKLGLKACEIAFTYSVYIKPEDAERIGKKAKELGIELSIHAPYFVNLNSDEAEKRAATKKRILDCCKIGELLGAKVVVFHPGYYTNKGKTDEDRAGSYDNIKKGILDLLEVIKENKWKINVFGSVDEVSRLVKETGCSFCIDFAHILAREKKVDYEKIIDAFPGKEWHCHFSGIEYGEKGEKNHIPTGKDNWKELLSHLPKDKEIRIINESPTMVEDAVEGFKIWEKMD